MFNTMVNITEEMKDLEDWMIWKNELWFSDIIKRLNENGRWGWKDNPELTFIKKGDKIHCCPKGYEAVGKIVSKEFLIKNFEENGKNGE